MKTRTKNQTEASKCADIATNTATNSAATALQSNDDKLLFLKKILQSMDVSDWALDERRELHMRMQRAGVLPPASCHLHSAA